MGERKYSAAFERDYKFYLKNVDVFTFCGTLTPRFEAIPDKRGRGAKEVFFLIDSTGKNYPCRAPVLLNKLLRCKASVNFHIKQLWAEGRADATLPWSEFAGDGINLEWSSRVVKGKKYAVKRQVPSMAKRYGFPDWVIDAVERQKIKILDRNPSV